ncbi:MAG: AgmX/PglI C-terminal domain-containing protein [Oligoflexales bacterium]
MSKVIILLTTLILSCVSYHPMETIKSLEKDENGTFFAFTADYTTNKDSCWLEIRNGNPGIGTSYKVNIKPGNHDYILRVEEGKYSFFVECFRKWATHDKKRSVFDVKKGAIKYIGTVLVTVKFTGEKFKYSTKIKAGKRVTEFFKGLSDKRVKAVDGSGTGGLTQDEILGPIRKKLNQIRECYEIELREVSIEGKIQIRFVIDIDGTTEKAEVTHSSINNSRMESCVTSIALSWIYPRPRGNKKVTVNYPFSFNVIPNEELVLYNLKEIFDNLVPKHSKEDNLELIKQQLNQIKPCYDLAKNRDNLKGTMHFQMTVTPKGKVAKVENSQTKINEPKMNACIINAMHQFLFPEINSEESIDVKYPLTFKTGKKAGSK